MKTENRQIFSGKYYPERSAGVEISALNRRLEFDRRAVEYIFAKGTWRRVDAVKGKG